MADQKITELPVKTSSGIATTDYLFGIDSSEGYQMLIKDLGDYIIQHVSSSLAGSNQTLAAAISALNSNSVFKQYQIAGGFTALDTALAGLSANTAYIAMVSGNNGAPNSLSLWAVFGLRNAAGNYATQVGISWDNAIHKRSKSNSSNWSEWANI